MSSNAKVLRAKLNRIVAVVNATVEGEDNLPGNQPRLPDQGLRDLRQEADELGQILDELDELGVRELPDGLRTDSLDDLTDAELLEITTNARAEMLMEHAEKVFARLEKALDLVAAGSIGGEPVKEAEQVLYFSMNGGSSPAEQKATARSVDSFFALVPGYRR